MIFKSNKAKAIFLIILSTLFTSVGQLLWKSGGANIKLETAIVLIKTTFFNYTFMLGWLLYVFAAALMITALKYGRLSLVHPFLSLTQIWTLMLGYTYLAEEITSVKIISVFLIVTGAILISASDKSVVGELI